MQSDKVGIKVHHIATLAHIPLKKEEEEELMKGFQTTMHVVDTLFSINVDKVLPTNQVTGLENVTRDDVIDTTRMFTQEEAIANAPRKKNGYFVVDQILEDN